MKVIRRPRGKKHTTTAKSSAAARKAGNRRAGRFERAFAMAISTYEEALRRLAKR
jgi:hypothetical protein